MNAPIPAPIGPAHPTLPDPDSSNDGPPSRLGPGREIPNRDMIFWSAIIGIVGGLLALAYYYLLKFSMLLLWKTLGGYDWLALPAAPGFHPFILIVTTLGGFLVGCVLKFVGVPGEIAAVVDNIHMERGRIDVQQTPAMILASLVSITAGGSAGPEAPLVQIIGSLGSFLGDKLKLRGDLVRTLTFCGMGTALGAFFGAPLGGALFALEIPHRRGLEYYEAIIPTIISAILGFFVFRSVIGFQGPIYHLPTLESISMLTAAYGLLLGLLGGFVAMLFVVLFKAIERLTHPLAHHRILLGTLGGLSIGLLAQLAPKTLFWGEYQIEWVINAGPQMVQHYGLHLAAAMFLLLALLKMLAIGCTLHSGFRGGFIFPLFFIGAVLGVALSLLVPQIPLPVAVICMMAAVNVAITKTPISTTVILISLTGMAMLPVVAVASFTSFLLTTRVSLIRTQRPRRPLHLAAPLHPTPS